MEEKTRQRRYYERHREEVLARQRAWKKAHKDQRRANRKYVPAGRKAEGLLRSADAATVFNAIFPIDLTDSDMRRLARGEYNFAGRTLVLPSLQFGKLYFREADVIEFATKLRDEILSWGEEQESPKSF